jgi:hypothetical protein
MSTHTVPLAVFSFMTMLMTMASFNTYSFKNNSTGTPIIEPSIHVLAARIAPGEFLPFSVRLLNFGIARRVDVIIYYKIFNEANKEIYSQNETLAVETTASFIKNIQLPKDTPPGVYKIVAEIVYANQVIAAISEFQFSVEKKIFGIFQSDFSWYTFLTLLASIASAGASHIARRYIQRNISKIKRFFSRMLEEIQKEDIRHLP